MTPARRIEIARKLEESLKLLERLAAQERIIEHQLSAAQEALARSRSKIAAKAH